MKETEECKQYITEKLMGIGVVVKEPFLDTIFQLWDQYYEEEWVPESEGITAFIYTEEEKRSYIQDRLPDIPHNIIADVLAVEETFFNGIESE